MNFIDNKVCDVSQPINVKKAEIFINLRFINNNYEVQVLPNNFPGSNVTARYTGTSIQVLNISPAFSPLGLTVWGKQYSYDIISKTYTESNNFRLVAVPTTTTFATSLTKNPNNTLTLEINTGIISNTNLLNFGVTEITTGDPNARMNLGLKWVNVSRLVSKIMFLYDDSCIDKENFTYIGVL